MRLCSGNFECLNNLAANRIFGDACDILLITDIYLIINGASIALTPKPQSAMNGIQGIPHPACKLIKAPAVAVKTGAPQAQMNGKLYTLGGL